MSDIAIHAETVDEHRFAAMAVLAEELTSGAGAELRPVEGWSPDATKTGSGMTATELVVTGVLSASTVKAVSAVLVAWVQARSKRKLTLRSGEDQLVVDGSVTQAQQALVEKWLGERAG
jgi:hypothetical protein